MRTPHVLVALALVVLAAGFSGCAKKPEAVIDYSRPLPPGAHALRRLDDQAVWPDFVAGFPQNRAQLIAAIDLSLDYLAHPSSEEFYPLEGTDITHELAVQSLTAFRGLVAEARAADELAQAIHNSFDVYQSVGCDDLGTVLFTGYYTPILEGSLEQTAEYPWPLYKLPDDLVKNEQGLCAGRRLPDGSVVPYPARRELETSGQLKGLELVYLKDKFDAYVCHVQGSASIRLPDGQQFEVGYAGKNAGPNAGRPIEYTSIGKALLADGKIAPETYSLEAIRRYFREHPEEMDRYLWQNESFVFFRQESGPPRGSLGVPVTPYVSLATDKKIFPPGCLAYAVTTVPVREGDYLIGRPFAAFLLDQDTGGAIRAAGRADIYLGVGPEAGQIAGWTTGVGQLYYLFLKTAAPAPLLITPPQT